MSIYNKFFLFSRNDACAIEMEEYVVVAGGTESKTVLKFNQDGYVEALPAMNGKHTGPACGHYYNALDELVSNNIN